MKIRYVKGDLIRADEEIIMHGCNAQGVMGSGVAKAIRNRWPYAYEVYAYEHKIHGLELGEVVWAKCEDKLIANCITQANFGRDGEQYCDYEAIRKCCQTVVAQASVRGNKAVAMPQIGAGLGGGDWRTIEAIIEEEFIEIKPVVYQL